MKPLFLSENLILYYFEAEGSVAVYYIDKRQTQVFTDIVNFDQFQQYLLNQ